MKRRNDAIRVCMRVIFACGFLSSSLSDALAATVVGPLPITMIRTGWNGDGFAIVTNQAMSNPANCAAPDGYMSDSASAGYKTYYAATLMAFASGKPVTVVISDTECVGGRPKIWGVYVAQ